MSQILRSASREPRVANELGARPGSTPDQLRLWIYSERVIKFVRSVRYPCLGY